MKTVEEAILSTDLATYFEKHKKFAYYVENGEFDWQNDDKKECKCNFILSKLLLLQNKNQNNSPFAHSFIYLFVQCL